jgi:hypothetical protein
MTNVSFFLGSTKTFSRFQELIIQDFTYMTESTPICENIFVKRKKKADYRVSAILIQN